MPLGQQPEGGVPYFTVEGANARIVHVVQFALAHPEVVTSFLETEMRRGRVLCPLSTLTDYQYGLSLWPLRCSAHASTTIRVSPPPAPPSASKQSSYEGVKHLVHTSGKPTQQKLWIVHGR